MAAEQNTPEVAALESRIASYLDAHKNKIEVDLTKSNLEFKKHSGFLFTGHQSGVSITIGFSDEGIEKGDSVDKLRSRFNWITLDKLPVPGLDGIPSQWEIYPQTPVSSFSDGITFDSYDPNTQVLHLTIQTRFFAINGSIPQNPRIGCGRAPPGTYLQVRRDIDGHVRVQGKLNFDNSSD